jgi:hypothetical protein
MYNPAQTDIQHALAADFEDSDFEPNALQADDFVVSPVDRIRRFFAEQAYVYRPIENVSAEWERYFRTSGFLEDYGLHSSLLTFIASHLEPQNFNVDINLNLHAPRESLAQLFFPLEGSFSPSKKITDIWIQSVKALAADVNEKTDIVFTSTIEVQHEFTKLLSGLFGTIAQQMRYGAPAELSITKGDAFTPGYEIQICDRFLILPSLAAQFLSLLREELISAISVGGVIKGAWGYVGLNSSGALYFFLTPPEMISDQTFVVAEEVE